METDKYCQASYYLAYWLASCRGFVMNLIWGRLAPVANIQPITHAQASFVWGEQVGHGNTSKMSVDFDTT